MQYVLLALLRYCLHLNCELANYDFSGDKGNGSRSLMVLSCKHTFLVKLYAGFIDPMQGSTNIKKHTIILVNE